MEEPALLAARPHHGRFPIPFVTHIREDGRPDFRVHNNTRRAECAERRLCQLCGAELGSELVFVGFKGSVECGVFGEPPMHRDCMEWAWEVCPFLAGAEWRADWAAAAAELTILPQPQLRPTALAIYVTDDYTAIPDPEGSGSVKWKVGLPAGAIEWRERF